MALAAFFEVEWSHINDGQYAPEYLGRRVYKTPDGLQMEPMEEYMKRKEAYDRAAKLTVREYSLIAQQLMDSDPDLNKTFEDEQYEESSIVREVEEVLREG